MIDARCSLVANLWVTPTQRRLPSPSQPPLNVLQQANEPKRRETFAKSAFLWGMAGDATDLRVEFIDFVGPP